MDNMKSEEMKAKEMKKKAKTMEAPKMSCFLSKRKTAVNLTAVFVSK
ncbi:MAG: hypothetical protein E6385_02775 [Haemophilus parainfluenzae]|nr:hypothetical protein [Haemophilus parainfluenzae]